MPGNVLTDDLAYHCSHPPGAGITVAGSARLRVDGGHAVTGAALLTATFAANCPNTGGSNLPCLHCISATSGTKLRVDGALVALADFVTTTDSAPPGSVVAVAPHSRMRSV